MAIQHYSIVISSLNVSLPLDAPHFAESTLWRLEVECNIRNAAKDASGTRLQSLVGPERCRIPCISVLVHVTKA